VLGDKSLRSAIDDYLQKQGRPSLAGQENTTVICNCLNITDKDLEEAYKKGDRTWADLQASTKIGTSCGACKEKAMELLHQFEHLYG
jgi:nitrogen fixation NifU-like protein